MEISWNLWGTLPHFLPQGAADADSSARVIMATMKKVIVCAPRSRRASRAAKMRTLLRHARPHGGHAAERVKQVRPDDRGLKDV